jgi:hypothetical protein
MFKKLKRRKLPRGNRGQGITEYAVVIAFVAIIISLVFSITTGRLSLAISAAFSVVSGNLNNVTDSIVGGGG